MRPVEFSRSAFFRFALILTAIFLSAYFAAGIVAYSALHEELDSRIQQAVELTAESFEDIYESGGETALITAIESHTASVELDDELVWLGSARDGKRLAGVPLPSPLDLHTGDVSGKVIAADEEDRYRIAVRNLGKIYLIAARSYEESDKIRGQIFSAFGWATSFILLFAIFAATLLARKAQGRLENISRTLRSVSHGEMTARISTTGSGDDLDRLSVDINDALDQLETTVDGIRQVTNDIAHDLRTPINRLGILLEQARSYSGDDKKYKELLDKAADEIQGVNSTFDALLRIAQIEAGARKSRFSAVSLHEIAHTLYEAYLPVAEEHGQELLMNIGSGSDVIIHGDRDLLTQLFANLVENAIRHGGIGAEIRLETSRDPQGVRLSVDDNGPGIPADQRDRALTRFFRLDTARNSPGSGLGLALVKAIADLHGAALILDDNHPGLVVHVIFSAFDDASLRDGHV